MESTLITYGYDIELMLMTPTENIEIESERIENITTHYNYDKNTMPVVYLQISLNPDLYNKFVTEQKNSTIIFSLYKYDINTAIKVRERVIYDNFMYLTTSNPAYTESFDKLGEKSSDEGLSYQTVYISLIKEESINNNRTLINTILKNTNLVSILHKFTNHMNMVMSTPDVNYEIDTLIIPPITSITNLIAFIDSQYTLYKKGYRFFRDFDKTYLLRYDGKAEPDGSSDFDTVIISIQDPLSDMSKNNTIEINVEQNAYVINIDATTTSFASDKFADLTYNKLIGIDTEGNTMELDLNIPRSPDSAEKVSLVTVENNNLEQLSVLRNTIESNSTRITFIKSEIDTSILTPNKEFFVRNYRLNQDYDGRYVLTERKDILVRNGTGFISNTICSLIKM